MGIYLGTQAVYPSGIEKVYVGTQLVYQKTTENYTELTISDAGSYTLNLYKEDTQLTKIYINNTLVTTSTTSGSQDIPITTSSENSVVKIANVGNWYFDNFCLGSSSNNENLASVDFSNENKMTSIGNSVFSYCSSLESIVIPSSVTSIGNSAFYGSGLISITIPESVTSIGNYVFENCYSLTSITIPNSVTSIGISAFEYCRSLTSITIPNSVTSIGDYAFRICRSLTSITIPSSVTSIGDYAFSDCIGLTSATINCSSISGEKPFYNCSNLTSLNLYKGSLFTTTLFPYIKYLTVQTEGINASALADNTKIQSVTINAGTIGNTAFDGVSSLWSVTLGNGVTSIGTQAFRNTGITSLTVPSSVTNIQANAFSRTSSLTVVNLYSPSSSTKITSAANAWFYSGNSNMKLHTLSSFNATSAQNAYGSKWNYRTLTAKYTVYYDL